MVVPLDPRCRFLQSTPAERAGPHAPDLLRGDEPRLFQDAHVLLHARARHVKPLGQIRDRRVCTSELLKQWWVPKSMGMSLLSLDADVRTGGKYRLVFSHGASTMAFFGTYIEVTPHSRLVWTNEESGDDGSVTTVTLEETDGKTRLVMRDLYPSKDALDAAGTGAADATVETFAQLDELLVTRGSDDIHRAGQVGSQSDPGQEPMHGHTRSHGDTDDLAARTR
jgi:uncharacterized protein YndB with AHSA1/START domain